MTSVEFDPFSDAYFNDPTEMYRGLRDHAPLYYSEKYDFYALSRYDDVVAASRDTTTFTSTHGLTYDSLSDPDFDVEAQMSMIMMDPPNHTRYRRLVARAFSPRYIEEREPMVRALMAEYLDPLMDRSEFDLVHDFTGPFPVEVICAILGIPKADRQAIRHNTDISLTREAGSGGMGQAQMDAAIASGMYFYQFIADKRNHLADDMCSALITAEIETETGEKATLSDVDIAGFLTLLAAAGSETVTKAVANAGVLFHRWPGEWDKIKADPSKISNSVEEVLRYWAPSQYQGRFSKQETVWYDQTLPAGKPVFLITGSANRDPREFENPDQFDVDRVQKMGITFGHGIHVCIGAALARLEIRSAIDELRVRWPHYSVDESRCERVHMSNVAGYSSVPFHTG
jgi:cytochrome P450